MTLVELANEITLQGDIRISLWEDGEETKVKTYTMTDDLSYMNIPKWAKEKEVNFLFCGGDGYLHVELKGGE